MANFWLKTFFFLFFPEWNKREHDKKQLSKTSQRPKCKGERGIYLLSDQVFQSSKTKLLLKILDMKDTAAN